MYAKRITKKQCSIARNRALKLIQEVRSKLKDKYKFADRLVGSGKWGTMIEDENGEYDLDYQILLTKNSKDYNNSPTEIKKDFLKAFESCKKTNETFQNSTTAITLVNKNNKSFHIDFVIIRCFPENKEIIRRNNKSETPTKNEFTWNQLPKWNLAYSKFKELSSSQKQDLIENYIIPAKVKEKLKVENDPTKISSAQIFVREVNNYDTKRKNR